MLIRINLLAEAQAAEELRRRDPVKRAAMGGALAAALMLVWYSYLQLGVLLANSSLTQADGQVETRTNEYQRVLADQREITELKQKLQKLQQLSAARFLQGNLLNALQKTAVSGVQLTRLRVVQSYDATTPDATAGQGGGGQSKSGKPGAITERIVVYLEARDFSDNPGDQVNQFKEAVAGQPYFQAALAETDAIRLSDLSAPQIGPDGKPFRSFTLECSYPEQTR